MKQKPSNSRRLRLKKSVPIVYYSYLGTFNNIIILYLLCKTTLITEYSHGTQLELI